MLNTARIPSTKADYKDFHAFLGQAGYEIEHTLKMYADEHRMRAQSTSYGGRSTYPTDEDLALSASTFFAMMFAALDQIQEAEQRLEFLDDDVDGDSEEYHHAQGELFGAKSLFISIANRFAEIETERLASTAYGEQPKRFLHTIIRGEGVVKGEPIYEYGVKDITLHDLMKTTPVYQPKYDFKF
jgi:hypothetical protein